MKKRTLTLKIFFLIVMNDIGESIAQLLMKKGLVETTTGTVGFSDLIGFIGQNAASGLVWLGITLYTLNFLIWIVILSRVELSVASPVGSTGYILIPLMAILFLKESVPPLRWAGILLVAAGIHLVSRSTPAALEAA